MRLIIAIAVLLLAGCDSRMRLNPGADLAVYVGSTDHMDNHRPEWATMSQQVLGYYSLTDGSITLSEQLRGMGIARVFAHELAHAYDHQRPRDVWELLSRYQGRDFDFNLHKD
jgi:hypothetical protein